MCPSEEPSSAAVHGASLYGVHHSPWVEGVRLAMAHHGLQPRLTSLPHGLVEVWRRGLVFPSLRLTDGTTHLDSFAIYALLEAHGYPLGVGSTPADVGASAQVELERLFMNYAPGRCIRGRRWRFIRGWSEIPEQPYRIRGAISRGFVSVYFFVLIRLGIRLAEARGRAVYDLALFEQHIQAWDRRLTTARWFTGSAPGFLDFALLGHIQCMSSGLTEELLPILRRQKHLSEWLQRMLDTVDGSLLTGIYTETTQIDLTSPTETSSDQSGEETDAEAREESRDEYDLDIDGVGDWLCVLNSTELDCEDDDFNNIVFERVPEGRKK